jgi:hypothetical protein
MNNVYRNSREDARNENPIAHLEHNPSTGRACHAC